MRELSLHILDIVQNSITAGSTLISIEIVEDAREDLLTILVSDNGKGMTPELLENVWDPFVTTRNTRKVGLGIPLLKGAAEACGGRLDIKSAPGKGTTVKAEFVYSHIDRAPLGDIVGTILTLVVCNPEIDYVYTHTVNDKNFIFDTREIKKAISGLELNHPEVILWMKEYLSENIKNMYGSVL
ncbi:MAG: ATP-binding protein [Clostridiaceae bacterium]|nr:ATP-binding protein [Clostridiaceae bacterium]